MTRNKWFASRDGRQYKPFGIDCQGAATLYGHHGGWTRPDEPSAEDEAPGNRAFWASLNPTAAVTARPRQRRWRWWPHA
ncbi:hypothetical protein [Micromonospora coxensis]|uniref:hypothetical protein n=1 Tax=Micromonospora coxensis TaxID=356852 RepID=UPI0034353D85